MPPKRVITCKVTESGTVLLVFAHHHFLDFRECKGHFSGSQISLKRWGVISYDHGCGGTDSFNTWMYILCTDMSRYGFLYKGSDRAAVRYPDVS